MNININKHNDLELALMVLLGYFGVSETRRKKLGSRYSNVQAKVNQILKGTMPESTNNSSNVKTLDVAIVEKVLKKFEPTSNDYQSYINEIINEIKRTV